MPIFQEANLQRSKGPLSLIWRGFHASHGPLDFNQRKPEITLPFGHVFKICQFFQSKFSDGPLRGRRFFIARGYWWNRNWLSLRQDTNDKADMPGTSGGAWAVSEAPCLSKAYPLRTIPARLQMESSKCLTRVHTAQKTPDHISGRGVAVNLSFRLPRGTFRAWLFFGCVDHAIQPLLIHRGCRQDRTARCSENVTPTSAHRSNTISVRACNMLPFYQSGKHRGLSHLVLEDGLRAGSHTMSAAFIEIAG